LARLGNGNSRPDRRRQNLRSNQHRRHPDLPRIPAPDILFPVRRFPTAENVCCPRSHDTGPGVLLGYRRMVLGEIWGALIFRSLGFAGNPDWGKEGLAFGNLFLLMIILALILFVFKHLRRRPAISLNPGGPQSFFGIRDGLFLLPCP